MPTSSPVKKAGQARTTSKMPKKSAEPVSVKRGRGRPAKPDAKHKDFAYQAKTIRLPKVAYEEAKLILVRSSVQGKDDRGVSDLLSDLLTQWVEKHR